MERAWSLHFFCASLVRFVVLFHVSFLYAISVSSSAQMLCTYFMNIVGSLFYWKLV